MRRGGDDMVRELDRPVCSLDRRRRLGSLARIIACRRRDRVGRCAWSERKHRRAAAAGHGSSTVSPHVPNDALHRVVEMSRAASGLVAVVVPTKDLLALLQQTISSIQAQSHRSWEAIVVDDGSTDKSAEWIQGLAERDKRIKWIPRP